MSLNRTLDQELLALSRGVSLECLVCGEFVMRLADGSHFCPECGSALRSAVAAASGSEIVGLGSYTEHAGRVTAGRFAGSRKVRTP